MAKAKVIREEVHNRYEYIYFRSRGFSVRECWEHALCCAFELDPDLKIEDFPCPATFDRRLRKKYSKDEIWYERHKYWLEPSWLKARKEGCR